MRLLRTKAAGFWSARGGVSAVEFAILLPTLLVVFLGGFTVAKTMAIGRKVTVTTRALADLTSQYKTMSADDVNTVMTASTQIIAPFDAKPLSIRLTEIQLDVTGLIAKITFSKVSGKGFTAYTTGSVFLNLPSNLPMTPGAAYILAETAYPYDVLTGSRFAPTIKLTDKIYMLPRLSAAVTYTGT